MRLFLILFCTWAASCVHTSHHAVPVELGDRSSLFFTGKGAAAGIMMDAFMGGLVLRLV